MAAYSTRARDGAPVSMPLAWDELSPKVPPNHFTVKTAPARLARRRDPWARYWKSKQKLDPATLKAVAGLR